MIKIGFVNGLCLQLFNSCIPVFILAFDFKLPFVADLLPCHCSLGSASSVLVSWMILKTSKATGPFCLHQQFPRESQCRTYCNSFTLPTLSIRCSQMLLLHFLKGLDVGVHVVISDNFRLCIYMYVCDFEGLIFFFFSLFSFILRFWINNSKVHQNLNVFQLQNAEIWLPHKSRCHSNSLFQPKGTLIRELIFLRGSQLKAEQRQLPKNNTNRSCNTSIQAGARPEGSEDHQVSVLET